MKQFSRLDLKALAGPENTDFGIYYGAKFLQKSAKSFTRNRYQYRVCITQTVFETGNREYIFVENDSGQKLPIFAIT